MKLATVALIPLFVGFLSAQQTTQTETQTTTTTGNAVNLNGTLIDQGCYTTHVQHKETNSDQNSTTTTETTKVTTECPATVTSTSYGILTPDGQFHRFDDAGNAKVVEMMKSNKDWQNDINEHKPLKVQVVAMPNGDVMVIKEIK